MNSRQNCPPATAIGCIAPRSNRSFPLGLNNACGPPRTTSITNGIAIATSRALVTLIPPRSGRPGPLRNSRRASSTHSGHWNPTGAGIMQSGQIGRSHRVQCTRVGTLGCR